MKRKMVYIGVPYFIGLLLVSFLPQKYDFALPLMIFCGMVFLKLVCGFSYKKIMVCAASLVVAVSYYRIYQNFVYDNIMGFDGKSVSFYGKVIEMDEYSSDKASYRIKGIINSSQTATVLVYTDAADVTYGDTVYINGVLCALENDYIFNAKDYYFGKGIHLEFDKVSQISIEHSDGISIKSISQDYKDYIVNRIRTVLTGAEGDVLTGIVFGEKSDMDSADKTAMYRSGIGHVMSVSGLHAAIIASAVLYLLRRCNVSRRGCFIASEAVIFAFGFCVGMPVPVIRALIMITLTQGAALLSRRADIFSSLCISVIILTLGNPFVIRDASFLLSVSGAYGIGVFAQFMTRDMNAKSRKDKFAKNMLQLIYVTLAVLPASMIYFNESSLISPISNLLLIPLCSIVLMLGLAVLISGGIGILMYPLLAAAGILCKIILKGMNLAGNLPFSYITLSEAHNKLAVVLSVLFVIITFAVFKSRRHTAIAVVISMILISSGNVVYAFVNRDIMEIAVLGRNSNAVIVVHYKGNTDVIDITGDKKASQYADAYLKSKGIDSINSLSIVANPYSSVLGYNENFTLYDVNKIMLPNYMYWLDNSKICLQDPEFMDFYDIEIKYPHYTIRISQNKTVEVEFGDFLFACSDAEYSDYADVFVSYGSFDEADAQCALLAILDVDADADADADVDVVNPSTVTGHNNLIFRIDNNYGNVDVRRL